MTDTGFRGPSGGLWAIFAGGRPFLPPLQQWSSLFLHCETSWISGGFLRVSEGRMVCTAWHTKGMTTQEEDRRRHGRKSGVSMGQRKPLDLMLISMHWPMLTAPYMWGGTV